MLNELSFNLENKNMSEKKPVSSEWKNKLGSGYLIKRGYNSATSSSLDDALAKVAKLEKLLEEAILLPKGTAPAGYEKAK